VPFRADHKHAAASDEQLKNRLPDNDDTLLNAARFFRCSACRGKQIILVPYSPETARSAVCHVAA
jgi:hypothetical protein